MDDKMDLQDLMNPPVPDQLEADECAVLRGDAIGSTAYTHRWVLSTLLNITEVLPQYLVMWDTTAQGEELRHQGQVEQKVVELGEEVESAACLLWDMTAERDVVLHLLNLQVVDVLQLASDIVSHSQAPRLTELMVGVTANLCCQGEGCDGVLGCVPLLNSCLTLLHTSDDVPTLVEAFRMFRLLLWHLVHRLSPSKCQASTLVLALKNHIPLKEAIVFMLKNSLSETLLDALCEFLEALMYLWLPEEHLYMASYYSESGLVEGVVEMIRQALKQWEKAGEQEMPGLVHRGVVILYSFIASPSALSIISSFDQYESLLEPVLVTYVDHVAKVERVEELVEEETARRLTFSLGLCELLVPTLRQPQLVMTVVRLLGLCLGGHHYTTATPNKHLVVGKGGKDAASRTRSCSESQNKGCLWLPHQVRRSKSHDEGHTRPPQTHRRRSKRTASSGTASMDVQSGTAPHAASPNYFRDFIAKSSQGSDCVKTNTLCSEDVCEADEGSTLKSLIESFVDYCVRVVRCCPDLSAVLTVLNQCHMHEVDTLFRAMRCRDPKLVGHLQEQVLDSGSHNRLVTILSDLYS